MIKAVLFDVGGTLIEPKPSVGRVYAEIAGQHGVKADANELQIRFKAAWKKQKLTGLLMDKDWWREVVTAVFADQTFKDFDAFFDDLYRSFSEPARWRIFPDVLPTFATLKERGVLCAVASNWDERLPKLLRDLNLAGHFDYQFISSFVGYAKPDPKFFQHALKMMGLEPEEVLHVGDDALEDIAGAQGVGIKTVLVERPQGSLSVVYDFVT